MASKLSGFGNFQLRDKPQRPGRNPKTGKEIPITARRVVTSMPARNSSRMLNSLRWNNGIKSAGGDELPPSQNKRYFTIGEVSELCGVKPHVLRYWEQEFNQLKPVKRRGNRRYYSITKSCWYEDSRTALQSGFFTISGAATVWMRCSQDVGCCGCWDPNKCPVGLRNEILKLA